MLLIYNENKVIIQINKRIVTEIDVIRRDLKILVNA